MTVQHLPVVDPPPTVDSVTAPSEAPAPLPSEISRVPAAEATGGVEWRYETNVLGEQVLVKVEDSSAVQVASAIAGRAEVRQHGAAPAFDDLDYEVGSDSQLTGTLIAVGAILMFLTAFTVWVVSITRGSSGATAGAFVLLGSLFWIVYLSLPARLQSRSFMIFDRRIRSLVDRRVGHTEHLLELRREQEVLNNMGAERTRRVNELGEAACALYLEGQLQFELISPAMRVAAMEQQIATQRERLEARKAGGS